MRVGVAVLTYRCGAAVGPTLASIAASTRVPDLLLVVDNDSGDDTVSFVTQSTPSAQVLVLDRNEGYGPAMNRAVRRLADAGAEMVLCLTHDCLLEPRCVEQLERELVDDESLGAVGPLLARVSDRERMWSAGGTLGGWRQAPRHLGSGSVVVRPHDASSRPVRWLDGAALAVRTTAFQQVNGFREDLFLYWEDIDLSLRLADAGWGVRVLPSAMAWQEPSFTPPYLAARNKLLVLRGRQGLRGLLLVVMETALLMVRDTLSGRRTAEGRPVAGLRWAGLRDALAGRLDREAALEREPAPPSLVQVAIVNPLPSTLAHYQRELVEVLQAVGVGFSVAASTPAEVKGSRRRVVVAARLVTDRLISPGTGTKVVLWPVFGRADPLTWVRRGGARFTQVVVHDPEPLRRQLGMGRVATAVGARVSRRTVTTIVHSEPARLALGQIGWSAPVLLPHPLLAPQPVPQRDRQGLVVVGQWKPARASAPLEALAAARRWDGRRCIHGRGWPSVAGWDVDSRFVAESELDDILTGAQCLVLPYDRYFQSGIAVRALESLTPVAGDRHPFLEDLFGLDWPGFVEDGDWAGAVGRLVQLPQQEIEARRALAWERVTSAWRGWAATLEPAPAPGRQD